MRNLVLLTLILILCICSCEVEPVPGYESEPYFMIEFANTQIPYKLFSKSKNKPIMEEVRRKEFPGIDMNADETQYFLIRNQKTDSFTLKYKLTTITERDEVYLKFQTVELIQSSILNSTLQKEQREYGYLHVPLLIIPE